MMREASRSRFPKADGRSGSAWKRRAILLLPLVLAAAPVLPEEQPAAAPVPTEEQAAMAPEAVAPGPAGPRTASGLPDEEASLPGLPPIGFWMLSRDKLPADWLGAPFGGRKLLEPINIVIVDRFASSEADAVARLLRACDKAEFPQREGHSSGYSARIGGKLFPQCPPGSDDSFSDAAFVLSNDHGRIFGPLAWNGAYCFVGAFSRESVGPVHKVKHRYVSFDRARDAFAKAMSGSGGYELGGYLDLGNAIVESAGLSTGDHDGIAVLLSALP